MPGQRVGLHRARRHAARARNRRSHARRCGGSGGDYAYPAGRGAGRAKDLGGGAPSGLRGVGTAVDERRKEDDQRWQRTHHGGVSEREDVEDRL